MKPVLRRKFAFAPGFTRADLKSTKSLDQKSPQLTRDKFQEGEGNRNDKNNGGSKTEFLTRYGWDCEGKKVLVNSHSFEVGFCGENQKFDAGSKAGLKNSFSVDVGSGNKVFPGIRVYDEKSLSRNDLFGEKRRLKNSLSVNAGNCRDGLFESRRYQEKSNNCNNLSGGKGCLKTGLSGSNKNCQEVSQSRIFQDKPLNGSLDIQPRGKGHLKNSQSVDVKCIKDIFESRAVQDAAVTNFEFPGGKRRLQNSKSVDVNIFSEKSADKNNSLSKTLPDTTKRHGEIDKLVKQFISKLKKLRETNSKNNHNNNNASHSKTGTDQATEYGGIMKGKQDPLSAKSSKVKKSIKFNIKEKAKKIEVSIAQQYRAEIAL